MDQETEYQTAEDKQELDPYASARNGHKHGINLDARRKLEIYLEEKTLQQRLVSLDFDYC